MTFRVLVTDEIDPDGVAVLVDEPGLAIDVEPTLPESELLARIESAARGMWRSSERSTPNTSSATAIVLPAGALMTATPSSVATSSAMLSTPTPARPTTLSRVARRRSSSEIRVAERPMMAS